MNVRAALTRMMAKVKRQKVSQVVCFELDQVGSSPQERRFVLDACKNLSTPIVPLTGSSEIEDVWKEIDRWMSGSGDAAPPASQELETDSAELANTGDASTELMKPAIKRGRKVTRNVALINQLLSDGQSLSKIAKAAGCSRATVQLQKKIWSAENAAASPVIEPPLKVPDRLPDCLIEKNESSSPLELNAGAIAYA